jgi:hypothetical protein
MPEYGYLHVGTVIRQDAASGGYLLDSVGLARTLKWGPVPSCVPGLAKGDKVVLGAKGMSRDDLVILAKINARFPDVGDIDGLLAALADKARVVDVDLLFAQLAGAVDDAAALAARVSAVEARATALEGRATALESGLSALTATVAANKIVSGGGWAVNEDYECPGTALQECDRMPFALQLWKVGNDVTQGPDRKHWVINKGGIWRPTITSRYTTPKRIPSGTAGEGTDRSFHIGVTARAFGPSNSMFESGLTGWTINPAAGAIAASTTQKHSGAQSMRVTPSGTSVNVGVLSDHTAVVPGEKVTATTWVWFTTAVTGNYSSAVNFYDASGTYLSTSLNSISVAAATWTPVIQTYTVPASAVFADVVPLLGGTPAASNVFYVDDVSIGPSFLDSAMFLYDENWNEVNAGTQHNRTVKVGGTDLLLSVGDKVVLYPYWGGAAADRLVFPASSNRMSLTYLGPVS